MFQSPVTLLITENELLLYAFVAAIVNGYLVAMYNSLQSKKLFLMTDINT